nr:MAG TPA: hypothetical protein [Caudoviricetes sp.]
MQLICRKTSSCLTSSPKGLNSAIASPIFEIYCSCANLSIFFAA